MDAVLVVDVAHRDADEFRAKLRHGPVHLGQGVVQEHEIQDPNLVFRGHAGHHRGQPQGQRQEDEAALIRGEEENTH